jgi:hypothetical protein
MPIPQRPPRRYRLCLNSDEKTYWAEYYVEGSRVTVEAVSENATLVQRTTQIGTSAELTARELLSELVSAGQVQESKW